MRFIFDGAGTTWLARFHEAREGPERRTGDLFFALRDRGLAYQVCDYCANAFGVRDVLKGRREPLLAQYMGHPGVAELVEEGFQVWVV